MNKPKPHIAKYKEIEADRLKGFLQEYKIIAIADMTGMPSPQLQKLRLSTKNSVLITMSKGRIIKIVFDELKDKIKGLDKLKEYIRGMPAILLTNDNPFKLSRILQKSKSSAPAKAGQIALNDIVVPAGPTSFPPGPIIGELGAIGIKSSVVDGKVAIKEDAVVVKEGKEISAPVVNILTRLGIEPMEIGINLLAALENGIIFTKNVLSINEGEYLNNIKLAASNAFKLTFSIVYPTKDNIKLLLQRAFRESEALADSQNILTSENVKKIIGKANLEAEVLKSKLNLPEVFKGTLEPKKEEKRQEESKTKSENTQSHKYGIKEEETVAQNILKKLQDEKIGKITKEKNDPEFKESEKVAQNILKKLQDEKIKKEEKK